MALQHLDEQDYRALPHLNQSILKHGLRSMLHMKNAMEVPSKTTDALIFGQLVHTLVLEPHAYAEQFAVAPEVDRRTKAGKQEWEDFLTVNHDRTPIKKADYDRACDMMGALRAHPVANTYLERIKDAEIACTWKHDGLDCKAKLDGVIPGRGKAKPIIVDLKTAMDASPAGFANSVAKFNYHFQQAFYVDGYAQNTKRRPRFIFLVVEKEPPHAVGVYTLDEDAERIGRKSYESVLKQWKLCSTSDKIEGYGNEVKEISLPGWAVPDSDIII